MILSGLKIRKALELEVPVEDIFKISIESEGDSAAREIYEDEITHSSEIENIEEIFGEDTFIYCYTKKKEIQINDSLKAYTFNMYMADIDGEDIKVESKINSEKTLEVLFLNTKVLSYSEYMRNLMEAQRYLGKFESGIFKRKFAGIGGFDMEEYANNHSLISYSGLHMLNFYLNDSGVMSTIGNIITANYERDILEQREYLSQDEYENLLDIVKKHKKLISMGINYGIK